MVVKGADRAKTHIRSGGTAHGKTAHYVHGKDDGPCRFLLLQGVGIYDNVAVGGG